MNSYTPVIGLEIHVELKTRSKMFCQCSADYFGKKPNTNTCPVCLALPGALPVPNRKALEWCIKIGKALNCKINLKTKFDRKHYFYPDLPKGFQISQYDEPVAIAGSLEISGQQSPLRQGSEGQAEVRKYGITRVHMEEDTGKLIHSGEESLVDFNRSGVPLVEIVTEPDFSNSDEVKEFLQELHTIIRYLEVSDADMEKGSMRMEPNISLRAVSGQQSPLRQGSEGQAEVRKLPNYKVEVKNINSFNFVKRAIDFEIKRQTELLEKGETPAQETRGYDEKTMKTVGQRSKEEAHDYRYFPEPDIPPMTFTQSYIDSIQLPELPEKKIQRYIADFQVDPRTAFTLSRSIEASGVFEKIVVAPEMLEVPNLTAGTANLIVNKKIDYKNPLEANKKLIKTMLTPVKTDVHTLKTTIDSILKQNPDAVSNFKAGKTSVLMFLVGQVMKEMKGQANASLVKEELLKSMK